MCVREKLKLKIAPNGSSIAAVAELELQNFKTSTNEQ
jgi:hypothetical protein